MNTAMEYQTHFCGIPPVVSDEFYGGDHAQLKTTETWIRAGYLLETVEIGETEYKPSHWMMASQSETSPTSQLLNRLWTYQQMPEDDRWPEAIWPTASAFDDARNFTCCLPLSLIPLPEISLSDDGEINFLWDSEGVHVDLGFYGTRTFSYFARSKDGQRFHADDVQASEGLPVQITKLLSA